MKTANGVDRSERDFTCHVDQQPHGSPRVWTLLISVYIYLGTGGRTGHSCGSSCGSSKLIMMTFQHIIQQKKVDFQIIGLYQLNF